MKEVWDEQSKDNLEITDFYEKPKEKEVLDSFVIPNTNNDYLGVVGPYVISPQALGWLKENYINNPEKFKDFEGKVDFSRTVIGNLVEVLGNGELKVALTVKAAKFSASAKEAIEAAKGTAETL